MRLLLVVILFFSVIGADTASACMGGFCGGGGGFSLSIDIAAFGGGCSHGCGGGFGFPGPFFGHGRMAFRRSRRLARRAFRAARWGFPGRANRLMARSEAAFDRGVFRASRPIFF